MGPWELDWAPGRVHGPVLPPHWAALLWGMVLPRLLLFFPTSALSLALHNASCAVHVLVPQGLPHPPPRKPEGPGADTLGPAEALSLSHAQTPTPKAEGVAPPCRNVHPFVPGGDTPAGSPEAGLTGQGPNSHSTHSHERPVKALTLLGDPWPWPGA